MKQYRINSENILQSSPDDCVLPPDDPIHELIKQHNLGGLGYVPTVKNNVAFPKSENKGKIQREQNIKPGSAEWFDLWYPRG